MEPSASTLSPFLPLALDALGLVWRAIDWPVAAFVVVSGVVVMDYLRAKIPLSRLGFALCAWLFYSIASASAEIAAGQFDWLTIPRRLFALPVAIGFYEFAKRRGWIGYLRSGGKNDK